MDNQTIKVKSNEEISSVRLTKKTKKMLESMAQGKETHEQIILRLIRTVTDLSKEEGTRIIEKGKLKGTKYQRTHKTIHVETDKNKYSVVCTYNDLAIISMLKKSTYLKNYKPDHLEWELDLEINNIKIGSKNWSDPEKIIQSDKSEYRLIYLICIKDVLEQTFDIQIYEVMTKPDYFTPDRWEKAYQRNGLSMDSFYSDVQKRLR
ncbi:hypothetical protein HQ545_02620 [Candidatus Woesearchaeota archaeon]|nr:hypothetical protein [Candidatus Woesearchaeota archaeon]